MGLALDKERPLSRENVEALIAEGNLVIIYHDKALCLNNWIARHPGGDKAVLHMVGRDASQEMDVYHSDATLKMAMGYQIGIVDLPWKSFTPPIQGGKFRSKEEQQHQQEQDEGIAVSDVDITPHGSPRTQNNNYNIIDQYDMELTKKDFAKYPSLDIDTQQKIIEEFRDLHVKLRSEGYFRCNYWGYAREAMRIGTLFLFAYILFGWRDSSKIWLALSATCLGLAWHQLTFIAHDAGHLGITHDYQVDSVIGVVVADFIGGLSIGWWKRNHNVHHFVTNNPEHDPDIQHLPFFAVSTRLLKSVTSTFYDRVIQFDAFAKKFIPIQSYTYYFILMFGRFNLYRLSWEYVIRGQGPRKGKAAWLRYLELVGLATFFYWYFYLVVTCSLKTSGERWMYVLISHFVTMPVHVQITLSHFAMSTSDFGVDESFPQRQLRTTMDVDCPWWIDYVHGGLQFQIIHHLFPRMPRHNLRAVQPKIIEFSKKLGLHYTIYGFTKGNQHVIGKLDEIAKQARIMLECNDFCKSELVSEMTLNNKKVA